MMQNIASTAGANKFADYQRAQDEIEKQRRELEAKQKRENSFWHRAGRGAIGAIPGLIAGIPGGPAGMAAGAGAGFAAGALAPQGTNAAALGVMAAGMANKGSSYLSNPSIPKTQAPGTTPMSVGQPGGLTVPMSAPMMPSQYGPAQDWQWMNNNANSMYSNA